MFYHILVVLAVSSVSTHLLAKPAQYLLPQKHLKLISNDVKPTSITTFMDDIVKVTLNEQQVELLSQRIHKETNTCGGFAELDPKDDLVKLKKEILLSNLNNKANSIFDNKTIKYKKQVTEFIAGLDKTRYMNFITRLSQFPDRSARSNNGKEASLWFENKVKSWKTEFSREDMTITVIPTPRYRQPSVLVTLKGQQSSEGIVIGGHIDTLSWNKPGADDDASGSSVLLEVLKHILESNTKFKKTVHFAFYAAEEVGLVGSKNVVNHFLNNKMTVNAVMQLDMVGYEHPNAKNKIHFVRDYTNLSLTNFTKKLAQTYLNKSVELIGDLNCNYACSDHARWDAKGFPTVFPFETSFSDHNPDIHSSRDSVNTVSVDHAFQFVKLASAFVFELSEPL